MHRFIPYKDFEIAKEKAVPDQTRHGKQWSASAPLGSLQDIIEDIEDRYDVNLPAILGIASMLGVFLLFLLPLYL